MTLSEISEIGSINLVYTYFKYQYFFRIPRQLRAHRKYFATSLRGFGEDAFHAAWWQVFQEFRPSQCLEIGVYRGQTISLWCLIQKLLDINPTRIAGLSPLDNSTDDVSHYPDIDYAEDIRINFSYFNQPQPQLFRGKSNSEQAKRFMETNKWDIIYIDGSHEEVVVKVDVANALENLAINGIIVLDDSSLYLTYTPEKGAFAGHPGPSRVLLDLDSQSLNHFLTVGHLNFLRRKG